MIDECPGVRSIFLFREAFQQIGNLLFLRVAALLINRERHLQMVAVARAFRQVRDRQVEFYAVVIVKHDDRQIAFEPIYHHFQRRLVAHRARLPRLFADDESSPAPPATLPATSSPVSRRRSAATCFSVLISMLLPSQTAV